MNGFLRNLSTIGTQRSVSSIIEDLKACIRSGDLEKGKKIHAGIIHSGEENTHIHVPNAVVNMYVKCGSLLDARRAFDTMVRRSAVSWNTLILGYARHGKGSTDLDEARALFQRMPCHGVIPWTTLIQGYAEIGREEIALELFSSVTTQGSEPDAQTFQAAFKACSGMAVKEPGTLVDGRLIKVGCLARARALHAQAGSASSCKWDVLLVNSLVDLYGKCGNLQDAWMVFVRMPQYDVVSWNTLMLGYCDNGKEEVSLELFDEMQAQGCVPDGRTYVAVIKACTSSLGKPGVKREEVIDKGVELHAQAAANHCVSDIYVAASLVNMYAKCGRMLDARRVFDKISQPDLVSWSALVLGYAENGEASLALELFDRMQLQAARQGLAVDPLAFISVLKACTRLAVMEEARELQAEGNRKLFIKPKSLEQGMAFHAQAAKNGCELDMFVACTLLDMYSKCGSLADARRIFDRLPSHNAVSWNALMLGYVESDEPDMVSLLFAFMRLEGCVADTGSFVPPLKAFSALASLERSRQAHGLDAVTTTFISVGTLKKTACLHSQASERGFDVNPVVASSLVEAYAKCGSLVDARRAFDSVQQRDTVIWTSLILAYADAVVPDARAFAAAIKACVSAPLLESGKALHADICQYGLEDDPLVLVSLVDLYGKHSTIAQARRCFDAAPDSSLEIVAWNSLLAGYSRQVDAAQVLELFFGLRDEGLRPNGITFVLVLTALSHAGLADKGRKVFRAMETKYRIVPSVEHYVCMVDMLSRSNRLDEAVEILKSMPRDHASSSPSSPSAVAWTMVLGACSKWKNVEVARIAFQELLASGCDHAAPYNLMANACTVN